MRITRSKGEEDDDVENDDAEAEEDDEVAENDLDASILRKCHSLDAPRSVPHAFSGSCAVETHMDMTKTTGPRPRAHRPRAQVLCERARSKRIYGPVTRAILCINLQVKGRGPRASQTLTACFARASAIDMHSDSSQEKFWSNLNTSIYMKKGGKTESGHLNQRPPTIKTPQSGRAVWKKYLRRPALLEPRSHSRPKGPSKNLYAGNIQNHRMKMRLTFRSFRTWSLRLCHRTYRL